MGKINTDRNLVDPDRVYAAIIDAHRDLDDAQSADFNAALVLILANHIGDDEAVIEALELARKTLGSLRVTVDS